jgi:Fe-S cluster biogenesis protein NfuA
MSDSDQETLGYDEILVRIGELAEELTSYPDPKVAEKVEELLDWVDVFHHTGLGRLIEMTRQWRGEIFLENVAKDPITGTFLDLYGLGEGEEATEEAEAAVHAALESVRPLVESHGGHIDVEKVIDGVVTLRLKGTCDGCPSSSATLTYGVEAALRENWPNFRRMEVLEGDATSVNPEAVDLECVTVPGGAPPPPPPAPQGPLLQIRRKA